MSWTNLVSLINMISCDITIDYIWNMWVRAEYINDAKCPGRYQKLEPNILKIFMIMKSLKVYPRLPTNMLTHQSFIDLDRRHAIPGSGTKDFIHQSRSLSCTFTLILLLHPTSGVIWRWGPERPGRGSTRNVFIP